MTDWLAASARSNPAGLALSFTTRQWTYAELDRWVDKVCRRLAGLGLRPGACLPVWLANRPLTVALIHAAARLGLVLAPLNTRLTVAEVQPLLARLGAEWLICDDPGRASALVDSTLAVVCLDDPGQPGVADWSALPERRFTAARPGLEDVQAIVFTSGTTGRPKGAALSFGNHFWSAVASAFRLGLRPDDCWLSCLPLYHVGGLAVILRSALYGTSISLLPRFEPSTVRQGLLDGPSSLVSLVPTMLYRLLPTVSPQEASCLRLVLLGGAAATPELVAAGLAAGWPLATTYGLTEAASQVATMPPEGLPRKPGSVGRALPFTTVRVIDEGGRPAGANQPGEILVSGPTVMTGYVDSPHETARALKDGWLYTGDIGFLDPDGDLWLLQRREDIILSGGENVYPMEVEAVIRQHPAVADACVVGLPDSEWGQRVGAMIALRPGETLSEAELDAFVRQRLAGYKLPRQRQLVAELPLTASGKVAREVVRSRLLDAASAAQYDDEH